MWEDECEAVKYTEEAEEAGLPLGSVDEGRRVREGGDVVVKTGIRGGTGEEGTDEIELVE